MRIRLVVVFVSLAATVVSASAQMGQTSGMKGNGFMQALTSSWEGAKRNITKSADLMSEVDYAFRPVDTVRTFGQILAHVAGANYVFCSAAKGEKSPHAEDEFEKSATTKAAIVKALNESMAYCDAAFASLDDVKALEVPEGRRSPRASGLIGNIGHLNQHYGNLVTYFRIKGIVPPSSRR
jgi:uncharacterized damage-inducible protein DinB